MPPPEKTAIAALGLVVALALPGIAQDATTEAPRDFGQIFGELITRIDPYLGQLSEMLGDLSGWHAPEILPNGDILIRRRQPASPTEPAPNDDDASSGPVLTPLEL